MFGWIVCSAWATPLSPSLQYRIIDHSLQKESYANVANQHYAGWLQTKEISVLCIKTSKEREILELFFGSRSVFKNVVQRPSSKKGEDFERE